MPLISGQRHSYCNNMEKNAKSDTQKKNRNTGKRKKAPIFIFIAMLIVGLAVLLYPSISDWWNTRRANSLIVEYDKQIDMMEEDDLENVRLAAIAYNSTIIGNVLPDAFAELQLPPDTTYDAILNPTNNGYMGTVEVPQIKQNLPIYHYTTTEVLEKGAGHLAGSSLPVGGESTHSVITAHRGLPSAKLFTDLDRLKEGDIFYLHILKETLAYEIDQIKVVEPENTSDLSIVPGKDYCTLVTCTPYAVNTHRLLVRGHRVPYSEEQYIEDSNNPIGPTGPSVLIRLLCVAAGIVIAFIIIFFIARRRKKKDDKEKKPKSKAAKGKKAKDKVPEAAVTSDKIAEDNAADDKVTEDTQK